MVRFLLSAIRSLALFHQRLAFFLRNQAGALEVPGRLLEAFEIVAVILPRPVAGAKILEAATFGSHERARRRVRATVKIIGHAVVIAIDGSDTARKGPDTC